MLVVNLFGAPSAGKSSGAAYIFGKLKMAGVNAEYSSEFIKGKVWEGNPMITSAQEYIFGKQSYQLRRLNGKVDVVVCDSPLLLSAFYNNDPVLGEEFDAVVWKVFNSYENFNFFVRRVKEYISAGRFQTEEESALVGENMEAFLEERDVDYITINGCQKDYDEVVDIILSYLENNKIDFE